MSDEQDKEETEVEAHGGGDKYGADDEPREETETEDEAEVEGHVKKYRHFKYR